MKVEINHFFTIFLLISHVCSKPVTQEDVTKFVNNAAENAKHIIKAKVDTIQIAGGSVGEAVAATGSSASGYISSMDPIEIADNLEETILANKVASIEKTFDAKRALIKHIQDAKEVHQANMESLADASLAGLNAAFNATAEGIKVTKTYVGDITDQLSVENTIQAISNAVEVSSFMVQELVDAAIKKLASVKQNLHDGAENFSSQELATGTKTSFGSVLEKSTAQVGTMADNVGVFDGIDTVVKTIAQLPLKVSKVLKGIQEQVTRQLEETMVDAAVTVEERTKSKEDQETVIDVSIKEEKAGDDGAEPFVDVKVTVSGKVDVNDNELMENIKKSVKNKLNTDKEIVFELVNLEDNEADV